MSSDTLTIGGNNAIKSVKVLSKLSNKKTDVCHYNFLFSKLYLGNIMNLSKYTSVKRRVIYCYEFVEAFVDSIEFFERFGVVDFVLTIRNIYKIIRKYFV